MNFFNFHRFQQRNLLKIRLLHLGEGIKNQTRIESDQLNLDIQMWMRKRFTILRLQMFYPREIALLLHVNQMLLHIELLYLKTANLTGKSKTPLYIQRSGITEEFKAILFRNMTYNVQLIPGTMAYSAFPRQIFAIPPFLFPLRSQWGKQRNIDTLNHKLSS